MINPVEAEVEQQASRIKPVARLLAAFACMAGGYEIMTEETLPAWLRVGGGALFFTAAVYNVHDALPDSRS